jgi:hypothetical protein
LRFDREQTALVFPAALLDQRVPGADPDLQQLLLEEVRRLDGQSDVIFSAQVRRMLRASLITGRRMAAVSTTQKPRTGIDRSGIRSECRCQASAAK